MKPEEIQRHAERFLVDRATMPDKRFEDAYSMWVESDSEEFGWVEDLEIYVRAGEILLEGGEESHNATQ